MNMEKKLKMGMVGGGPGAFIGDVHRKAAVMDGEVEFVGGVFSSEPEKSRSMGRELYLDDSRVYEDYHQMITKELELSEDEGFDFVSICTPNNSHFHIAKDLLEAGFNVMCEKPLTINVDQAIELKKIVEESDKVFGLMHNYTGYPMVKLGKDMVKAGELGDIRKVVVQYPQEWLATAIEEAGNVQASWRTDPKQSGGAGCMGDIGTHAANLAEYISGLEITDVCADLTRFVKGRRLEDDGNCLVKYNNGAKGILFASQVSIGEENNLAIWIYGEKGGLEWHQENPNYLYYKQLDAPVQVWRRGNDYVAEKSKAAARATRLPFGHPEGFIEAFANNYFNFADTLRAKLQGQKPDELISDFPGVCEGVRGMLFIETVLESSNSDVKWTQMKEEEV